MEKKNESADPAVKQPLRKDEPMQTGMMKEGMTKGDVKDAAKNKGTQLKDMITNEEKSMPPTTLSK